MAPPDSHINSTIISTKINNRISMQMLEPKLHRVREKRDQQYFGHNFDKFKYIVVIFCKEYCDGNVKLPTQQKSASPN